jgi:hypothetical protein
LLDRPRAQRQVTNQLDVDEPMLPALLYERALDVSSHRKVNVQAMSAWMQLRDPQVRKRVPIEITAKAPEEPRYVCP